MFIAVLELRSYYSAKKIICITFSGLVFICNKRRIMACIVENYNPAFTNGAGSLVFSTAVAKTSCSSTYSEGMPGTENNGAAASEDLLRDVCIPPSALHSQSPSAQDVADPAKLLEYYHRHPEVLDAGVQGTSTVAVAALSSVEIPPAHHAPDTIPDLPQNIPLSLFQEQVVEPPWWESVLAVPIHNTLKERESALAPIQFNSPQLEQRYMTCACQDLIMYIYIVHDIIMSMM